MKKTSRISAFIFLAFILLTQNICFGNSYPKGILNKNKVYEASKTITNNAYPNSDDVLLDDYIIEKYNSNGTATIWDDTFIKILTEKGKRDNQTLSLYFTLPYSTVNLTLLNIIKPDGTVQDIDISKQSRVMINNSQMNSNIYNPNSKIFKVNIPDLQIGDIIRYVSHRKQVKARMPNTWSDYSVFENTTPVKHLTLEIISPKTLPLKKINLLAKVKNSVSYTSATDKETATTTHKWEVKDVPRMFPEPNMPPVYSVVQRLLVSTVADWETISKWYWNLCLPHINATTPEMKEKVAQLIKGKKTDIEKIETIYYYVAQKIRYMGITTEKDAPGYEPHDVNITFDNKYGVCRDKAALLVAMLRIAGFKSYPVLIMVGPKMDKEVPMINFNHAITCVELTPGHYTLMDPTNENSKQLLPSYLCDKSYLVAKPNGETLRTTPIIPVDKNLMDIITDGQLDNSGKLTAKVQLNFEGINDNAYRGLFATLTPEDRQLFFEKVLRKILPTAKLITLTISPENMHDTSESLSVNIGYEAEKILVKENYTAMLPLPWFGKTVGIINYVIREAGLKKRKYPLETSTTCGYKEKFNIKFTNKHLKFKSIPDFTDVKTDTITYKQKLKYADRTLKGTGEFLLKVVELSPKQYLSFKNTLKDLEINRKKMPILSFTNQSSDRPDTISETDAIIIDNRTEIILKDVHTWTENNYTKMKILSYPGKKENSEIKIPYNPIWESVKIEKAVVTGKDGGKQEISKDEMNIMDAPWTGSAPRYPAGKILVLNLPGVEIGSTIEIQATSHVKDKPFFSDIKSFRTINPIEKMRYKISVPKDIKLKITRKNLDGILEKTTESSENIIYEWKAKDQKSLKKESSLPPAWTFIPTIILSTGDWKTYSDQLNKKFIDAAKTTPEISSLAKKLITGQKSNEDKITAIRNYVAKNIREAGPFFTDIPLDSITPALRTISDGYGNNADQAIVLFSILKAAELSPEVILSSDYPANIKIITKPIMESPQLNFFNEVLVTVKTVNDNTVYLNDTDEYSILGATANEYNIGLNLNTATAVTIKPLKNKSNKMLLDYQIKLDDNGDATLDITKKYYGNYFGLFNKQFSEQRPEERDRYYQSAVAMVSQSAEPLSKLVSNFKSYPGIEKFSVKVLDFCTINNSYYYFKIPLNLNGVFNLGKDKRFYPYYRNARSNFLHKYSVQLPEKFSREIITPQEEKFILPNNSGKIELKPLSVATKIWNEIVNIDIQPSIYTPEQYNEILRMDQKISSPSTHTILLEK